MVSRSASVAGVVAVGAEDAIASGGCRTAEKVAAVRRLLMAAVMAAVAVVVTPAVAVVP